MSAHVLGTAVLGLLASHASGSEDLGPFLWGCSKERALMASSSMLWEQRAHADPAQVSAAQA